MRVHNIFIFIAKNKYHTMIEFYGSYYIADPQILGDYEKKYIENLKAEIENSSIYESNLIINLTWLNPNDSNLILWINKNAVPKSTKIYFTGFIDGMSWFTHTSTYQQLVEMKIPIELVGFSPTNWKSFIPSLMESYSDNDLQLDKDIQYTFLSYNRKPRPHRQTIIRMLIDNNLTDRAYVTYQRGNFEIIDKRTGDTDQELHNSDDRFSRPEDLFTLGNLEVWKKSYCILVSETEAGDPWQLSEKTWKPILGLRPYVHNGNEQLYKILHKLDLYTPSDLFKNTELNKADPLTLIEHFKWLNEKTPQELYDLWCSQYFMLKHNRNRFLELATEL
jgi:hypothetical protein